MVRRLLTSPTVTVLLAVALVVSLLRPDGSAPPPGSAGGVETLRLEDTPRTHISSYGSVTCELELNRPVLASGLRKHLRLIDDAGGPIEFGLEGSRRHWELTLRERPERGSTLVLSRGLRAGRGDAVLAEEVRHRLEWPFELRLVDAEATSERIDLDFSHWLAEQDLRGFVETEPAPRRIRSSGTTLRVHGDFVPGTRVPVTIRKGLRADGGLRLERDVTHVVRIPDHAPRARFGQRGHTLSSKAHRELEIEGVNTPALEIETRRLYPNNLVPYALGWKSASRLAAPPDKRLLRIDAERNERWKRRLDLSDLRPGIYRVSIQDPDEHWNRDRRILQITDLAPVVRVRPEGLAAFVVRISDGTPVADAEIAAYSRQNQLCARGVTDREGLFLARELDGEPYVVTAQRDGDTAYVSLHRHALAHDAREIEGRPPARGAEAFLYTDRGVVRPGERCRAGVILRPASEGLPVRIDLLAPDRRVVKSVHRKTSRFGLASVELPFAFDAPTGPYAVEAYVPGRKEAAGRAAFRVEAVVPDRIEPAVTLPEGDLEAGAKIDVGVSARLLIGLPAAGLRARTRVRYAPAGFDEVEGYSFGELEPPSPFVREQGELELDDRGEAGITVELPGGRGALATFELEVIDVSGRAAFARETRRVLPSEPRLALALPAHDTFEIPVLLVGAGARGIREVEVALEGVAEKTVRLFPGVARGAAKGAHGVARFDDPGDGTFVLRARAPGCLPASTTFQRWGGRTYGDLAGEGLPLKAVEGAIEVDAPFAGSGLLTLEGTDLFQARRMSLRAGVQRVELPGPNPRDRDAYATLTLVGSSPPARRMGAVHIARPKPRLGVELELEERALPGSTLAVRVRTSAPADVWVHAVDEGVLRLTGHTTPDPAAFFGARRRLDTRVADAYTRILQRMRFGDEPEPGGGGKGETALAQRLDPTARRTIESVALAARGNDVRFELPANYEGRLRVFAVAAGEAAAGSAARRVIVKPPISVRVHLPRAVAPGDEFYVPIEVRPAEASYTVELDGLELLPERPRTKVRAAPRIGVASLTVVAGNGGHVTRRTARLSVRPPAPFVVRHEVRTIQPGADAELPGEWLASTRRARILAGGSADLGLLPALERLLEYPHGCLEQTTSRAFPLLAWSELARLAHPDGGAPPDRVAAGVERVLSMQTSGGGLAMWPGGREPNPFGSVYAAHFLVEAKRMGRAVPQKRLDRLLDYIDRHEEGAYAAYVLTLAGRATGPRLARLADESLRLEERAHVAAAMILVGETERADELLGVAGDPWAAPRESGGSLSSPVRVAATLLCALVDAGRSDPRIDELALRLRGAAARDSQTTQESAAALLALAKHRANAPKDLRGELLVGTRRHSFDGVHGARAEIGPGQPWRFSLRSNRPATVVIRTEGVPLRADPGEIARGMSVKRTIEGSANGGAYRQGRVYRVVIEGTAPPGAANLLVTDLLPGGFEIEQARDQSGTLEPDRVEPRDDRVLFFRTAPIDGEFRQEYLVRAVTEGRFVQPPVQAELMYDPTILARSCGGGTVEVRR